uniref:DUF5641 domain-containing protein n=2 Tax=Lutzomyia longipalpis TaxID=7200 RepID=A0A1B0CT72_LUTLO
MIFRSRGGIVSAVTRVENYISGFTEEEKGFMGSRMNLESQRNIVLSMREKYTTVQTQIIADQKSAEEREKEEMNRDAFYNRCDTLVREIDALIQDIPDVKDNGGASVQSSIPSELMHFMTSFMHQSESKHQQQMELLLSTLTNTSSVGSAPPVAIERTPVCKLPQMSLPTFDGKYSSWCSFKDRFTASVINYTGLSNVQRLEYLQASVKGDAASAIKHLSTTDGNFTVAWQILINKFERKNEIVGEHIRTFFAMPKLTASNSTAIHEITNTISECTMALDAMNVSSRDPWLIQYTLDLLDSESRVLWGRECGSEVPTLAKFMDFLNQRCVDSKNRTQMQPKTPTQNSSNSRQSVNKSAKKQGSVYNVTSSENSTCRCCHEKYHPLYKCQKFLNMNADDRFQVVKQLSLCRNCFSTHMTHSCTYQKCQKCQAKHNVLLHDKFSPNSEAPTNAQPPVEKTPKLPATIGASAPGPSTSNVCTVSSRPDNTINEAPPRVFLATALVNIFTATGDAIPCRLMLDGGAQLNIMSASLYERLNLPKIPSKLSICGVNGRRSRARFYVNTTISSRLSDASFTFKAFVLPTVSGELPNWNVDHSAIPIPPDVPLADPTWALQQPVDLLLGGNPYWASLLNDVVELGPGLPLLRETVFGYVVAGEQEPSFPMDPEDTDDFCTLNATTLESLDTTLRQFFELESVPEDTDLTDDQIAAEHHFASTYTRNAEGRFVVKLPFRIDPQVLGDSRPLAIRRLFALERRFDKNPALRALYNEHKSHPIQDFRVTRVCFGIASSPFLATRALIQLALDHQSTHPLAAAALLSAFYMDDLLFSCSSLEEALQTKAQLIEVLNSAGFPLTKWSGNHKELLSGDASEDADTHFEDTITKTLGLKWNRNLDTFGFVSPISPTENCTTKRQLTSAVARLFDPVGLIGPVIILAKVLIQEVHHHCKNWDDPLPGELIAKWQEFIQTSQSIDQLSIPRWVSSIANPSKVDFHVFSDASQLAYGATIFVVTEDLSGNICSRLLTAKSRVAPIKVLTIPRLELCGALLASELAATIQPIYNPNTTHFWCDSTIVLYWIHSPPESYKIFIANRLKKIQAVSTASQWRHQESQEFGKKFRLFYLNTLQQRSKWKVAKPNITTGEIVLFLDETQSGSPWVLGQIQAIHPGPQNRVRVVDVRTPRGVYTRPITKLARLPSGDFNSLCSETSDDPPEHPGEHVQHPL